MDFDMDRQNNLTANTFSGDNQYPHPFTMIPPPPLPPTFHPPNIPPPPIPPLGIQPPPFPSPITEPIFLPPQFSLKPTPQTFHESDVISVCHDSTPSLLQQASIKNETQKEQLMNQDFVDDWLKSKGNFQLFKPTRDIRNLKVHMVKEKLNSVYRLIKELENGARTLNVMVKTVTPAEWNQKCGEIEEKKKELMDLINELKFTDREVEELKKKCSKRFKKRERLKRQRKKWKENEKIKKQNLDFQIDNWQKEMQEGVERAQREEEIAREADAVLWGVTQKKTEARRQVALLSALLDLRQVREHRLTAAGKPVSQTQIETFNTVIEGLKKMWSKHLDECLLEEQALRGMLTKADINEDPVKTYKKLVLNEWETAIFGAVGTLDSNMKTDQLLSIRHDWDQFAVNEHTVLSSTVPPGWVLPETPSSDLWSRLLKVLT